MSHVTTKEVSAMTGVPTATLRYWRSVDQGPRSFNLGRRVFYRREDVESWIENQIENTARGEQPTPAA